MAAFPTNIKWGLAALVDLEYFAAPSADAKDDREKDRSFYLEALSAYPEITRSGLLRLWVENRRRQHEQARPAALLPGQIFQEVHALLKRALVAAGMAAGAGAAASVLIYSGRLPVNVAVFFGVTVVFPYLFLLVGVLAHLLGASGAWTGHGVLAALFRAVFRKIIHFSKKGLSGENRLKIEAAMGSLVSRKGVFGATGFWILFCLAQRFALGYGLGAVCATVLRVLFSDLAFGWQSTLQLSARAVHGVVEYLALPWSWALPTDLAHPTLAQIEGSRMVLKEGLAHLQSADLAAWWPFLILCILVYGVLPRLVFLLLGGRGLNRAMAGLDFSHPSAMAILDRMIGPLVAFGAKAGSPVLEKDKPVPEKQESLPSAGSVTAVVADEVLSPGLGQALERMAARRPGVRWDGIIEFTDDPGGEKALLDQLARKNPDEILVIMEAWRPPIAETLDFIRAVAGAAGKSAHVRVALLGKPVGPEAFAPVKPEDAAVWKNKVAAMANGRISVWPMELSDEISRKSDAAEQAER